MAIVEKPKYESNKVATGRPGASFVSKEPRPSNIMRTADPNVNIVPKGAPKIQSQQSGLLGGIADSGLSSGYGSGANPSTGGTPVTDKPTEPGATTESPISPTPAGPTDPGREPGSEATTGPVLDKVTPNETVAGQLQGLLSSGNPLVQQAKTNAKQFANQRGLLNSQMAASAGEQAAFNAMMPVAQQDAQTNFSQSVLNQNTSNADYMATKTQDFQKEMTTMSQDFQKELTQIGYDNKMQEMLLAHFGNAINTNNSFLTALAGNSDVTTAEYDAVKQSILNSMETFANLWKVSADSDDVFDFSGAI